MSNGPPSYRRLWIAFGLVSLTLYLGNSMSLELKASDNRVSGLAADQAIEGAAHGGLGPGLSPNAALTLGLKVDVDALPRPLLNQITHGQVDLNDPAVTLALLKLNSVPGVTGFFKPDGTLKSVGIQCALCHSTVDNSLVPGIRTRARRLGES